MMGTCTIGKIQQEHLITKDAFEAKRQDLPDKCSSSGDSTVHETLRSSWASSHISCLQPERSKLRYFALNPHLLLLATADTCLALTLPGCPLEMQESWVKQKNIQRATKICFRQENDPFFLLGAHSCIT